MCGIAGFTDFTKNIANDSDILEKMTERLANRGLDDQGFWNDENTALGHRRLTVIDPEGGRQPMEAARGGHSYVIVYNGELYNTEDIRQQLISKGWSFRGWSDTEVLLDSYIEWGENCLEKLNGIFALAIWDVQKKTLFLARDRIGVKPLFYCRRGSLFLFASEIKAILAHPSVPAELGKEGLAEVFVMGPARTPGCGVFSGISELKPGYCMTVDKKGVEVKQYWSLDSHAHEEDFKETVKTVRELFYDAVKRQLVSDVPLCVLLSGGLDSSAISAVASETYREKGERIETFSIDYVGNDKYFP
jgi:asparagine synthase (glutamine-hydrolysing)